MDKEITQKLLTHITGQNARQSIEEPLTERENGVLMLVAKGFTNKAIGVQLNISDRTVQGHLAHIFSKLQASSRTEAVMRAVSLGWLPADIGQLDLGDG
jgi:DNA-binding NarL/FixJ family response regulator